LRAPVGACHFRGRPAFGGDERRPEGRLQGEFVQATLRGVGQCLEEFHPPGPVADRLPMGTALQGRSPGLPPILHGSTRVPPALEMDGQFRGDLPRLRAITGLLPRANALMQPHAPPGWHPLVHALLIHRVDETIPRCHRPVRPYRGPPRLQKLLPAGQGGTPVLDVARLAVDARSPGGPPQLSPRPHSPVHPPPGPRGCPPPPVPRSGAAGSPPPPRPPLPAPPVPPSRRRPPAARPAAPWRL